MKHIATRAAIAALVVALGGCGLFKTTSPISGRSVTADELAAEHRAAEQKAQATETEMRRGLETAERTAATARAKAKRAFDLAAAQIESDAAAKLRTAAAEHEQTQSEADAAFAAIVDDTKAKLDALTAAREQRAADVESALAAIREKAEWASAIVGTAESIGGLFGPVGGVASAVIGAGGLLFGLKGRRDANSIMAATTRIVDAIDVLKERDPAVASAFRANGKLLAEWMGPEAVRVVNKAQL
jgi:hypothetical protein